MALAAFADFPARFVEVEPHDTYQPVDLLLHYTR